MVPIYARGQHLSVWSGQGSPNLCWFHMVCPWPNRMLYFECSHISNVPSTVCAFCFFFRRNSFLSVSMRSQRYFSPESLKISFWRKSCYMEQGLCRVSRDLVLPFHPWIGDGIVYNRVSPPYDHQCPSSHARFSYRLGSWAIPLGPIGDNVSITHSVIFKTK